MNDSTDTTLELQHHLGADSSDGELVSDIASGEERALGALYTRHVRPVYGMVLRMLQDSEAAEQVVHDAFLRVWRRPGSFDPLRSQFRTWLLTVAHHLAVDELRRRRARQALMQRELDDASFRLEGPSASDPQSDPPAAAEAEEVRAEVRAALASLPGVQRAAIELAYFGGLSQNEIAQATGVPLGTIKSRIRFGMMALQAELEQRGFGSDCSGQRGG